MAWVNAVLIAYALLTLGGGIMGYVEKQSLPSIISGVVIAALLGVAVFLSRTNRTAGYGLAAVVTLLTLGFFLTRGLGKPIPTTMVSASVIVLACLAAGHFMNRNP
jgi:uncharacterized membrane protein (UPF0136 family)